MYLMDSLKKYVDKQNANEHGQNFDVTEIDGVWWHEYGMCDNDTFSKRHDDNVTRWLGSFEEQLLMNKEYWEVCCNSVDESDEQMINNIDQQQNRLKRQMMLMW